MHNASLRLCKTSTTTTTTTDTHPHTHPHQAKFGIPMVAQNQLEIYTTAVLQASIKPPSPPREGAWRSAMDRLGELSCKAYRCGGRGG